MPVLTEGKFAGEFIISEANGHQSRDTGTLITGQKLNAGTILGKITASGKFTQVAPAASDGSQNAAAILYANTDATLADTPCVIVDRNAEVNANKLTYADAVSGHITSANASLAAVGIIVRAAV